MLNEAVHRYYKVIFSPARGKSRLPVDDRLKQKLEEVNNFVGYLDKIIVELNQPCDRYPSYKADENCESVGIGDCCYQ